MPETRLPTVAFFAVLASLSSRSELADAQATKPTAAATGPVDETTRARSRFEEAVRLADVGDHDAARVIFEDVWRVLKEPAVVYNLARSEQLAGRSADAVVHFRTFLSIPDPRITGATRDRAWQNYEALRRLVAFVLIDTDKGARVWIDGVETQVSVGSPAVVMPGSHRIRATVKGGQVVEKTTIAVANGDRVVNFRTTPCWTKPRPPLPKDQKFVAFIGEPCDDE